MFEKTREKEESEREVDENQISISDLEEQNPEVTTDTANSTDNKPDDTDGDEASVFEEEPSAEDDIIDVD